MVKRNIDILINGKDRASRSFKRSASAAQQLKSTLTSLAAVTGVTFGLEGIRRGLSSLIDLGDDIGKASKRIGITAEEFQKLTFAARRSGAATDDIEKALKRMSSTIFDAGQGLAESKRALDALGISLSDIEDKSPERQFAMIADRLSKIKDASTKAALAQDLFGRAGTKLIPMIGDYDNLAKRAEEVGIVTSENVKAAEQFKDSIEDLTTSMKSMVMNSGIIPFLSSVAEGINRVFTTAQKFDPNKDYEEFRKEQDKKGLEGRLKQAEAYHKEWARRGLITEEELQEDLKRIRSKYPIEPPGTLTGGRKAVGTEPAKKIAKTATTESEIKKLATAITSQKIGVSQQDTITATVSRFLSFRQKGGQTDRTAEDNKKSNETIAENTKEMVTALQDISNKLDTSATIVLQPANFGA